MAQTSTKRASWRSSTCSGSRPSQGKWLLGHIVRVIHGKDGLVRTVEVKTEYPCRCCDPYRTLSVGGIREPLP